MPLAKTTGSASCLKVTMIRAWPFKGNVKEITDRDHVYRLIRRLLLNAFLIYLLPKVSKNV
jgi:hypothetical protein